MTLKLNEVRDNLGARKKKKLIGRGIGSGKGKTSGRGGKGQTARSGVALNGFEGGQNPIYRRLPKRGFKNIHAQKYFELTFEKINTLIENKKITSTDVIDRDLLIRTGVMKKWQECVSLINSGMLNHKISLQITRASKSAEECVKKAGGSVSFG